jgi:hypothetical protein
MTLMLRFVTGSTVRKLAVMYLAFFLRNQA